MSMYADDSHRRGDLITNSFSSHNVIYPLHGHEGPSLARAFQERKERRVAGSKAKRPRGLGDLEHSECLHSPSLPPENWDH